MNSPATPLSEREPVRSTPPPGAVRLGLAIFGLALATALVATLNHRGLIPSFEAVAPLTVEQKTDLLARAARSGDLLSIRRTLDAQMQADAADSRGVTPLMIAALYGHEEVVAELLRRGASANARDDDGFSPLSYAIGNGQAATANQLLDAGSHPGIAAVPGEPAIYFAARTGAAALSAALLAATDGALPGAPDALLHAVRHNNATIAGQLLESGVDPLVLVERPETSHPLDLAARQEDLAMVALLLASNAAPALVQSADPSLVDEAVLRGQTDLARLLVDADFPIADESAALAAAVDRGDRESVTLLLASGARPGDLVARAVRARYWELAELLLESGANPDAFVAGGEPALFSAFRFGRLPFAEKLLAAGASTSLPGLEGQPPIALAVATANQAFLNLLLASGADPDIRLPSPPSKAFMELIEGDKLRFYLGEDSGFTPIMIAAGTGNHDAIKALIAHGASKGTTTTNWKRYPISIAAESKDIYAQQLLLGRDPQIEDPAEQRKIVVDLASQKVTLYQAGDVLLSSKISSGKAGYRPPTGEFVGSNKHRHWNSTLYGSSMPYFMRFSCDSFGLHQGYVPDYPASHGCIRMPESNVRAFWKVVRVGDPVSIIE